MRNSIVTQVYKYSQSKYTASVSLIFPKYLWVVDKFAWRRIIFDTISMGTPDLLAYVAACLLIMRFYINVYLFSGIFSYFPGSGVAQGKNPLITLDFFMDDIIL